MRPNEWHLGWGVKIMWVVVHVVGVGGLLVLDSDLYHLSVSYSWWAAGSTTCCCWPLWFSIIALQDHPLAT